MPRSTMFRPVIGRAETDIFLNAFNEVVVVEALSSDRTHEQCSIVRHSSNTTRPLFAARMTASVLLLACNLPKVLVRCS